MQIIETNDPVEAQRCRRVQYNGHPTSVTLGGSKFVGVVKSVKEEVGPRWIITLSQKKPKPSRGRDIGPHTISELRGFNRRQGLSAKRGGRHTRTVE